MDTPEIIIIIIPYGRINSRMTSYLKIFATGRTNRKFSPPGCSQLPEIQNTFVPPKAFGFDTTGKYINISLILIDEVCVHMYEGSI